MTRRIERYLLVEITPYFVLALLVLTVLVLASQMAQFAELFVKRDVPPMLVRTLLASLIPRILVLTLPLSLLVAVMTGLSRLHGDHELAVLFTSGIGRRHLLAPLLLLALPTSAVTFYLAAFDMPHAIRRVKEIRAELILQGIRLQVKPRTFDDRFAGMILYIGEVDRQADLWRYLFLALEGQRTDPNSAIGPTLITASRGRLELGKTPEDSRLSLYDGIVHRRLRTDNGSRYEVEAFERTTIRFDAQSREAEQLRTELETGTVPVRSKIQEMTLPELWAARHDPLLGRRALTEFHKRVAVSASPLVLVAVGVALATTRRRGGRSYGFWLSLLLAAIYYLLLLGGENLARAGRLPPFVALWLGNIAMASYSALRLSERFSLTRTIERIAERLRLTSTASPPLRAQIALTWDALRARAQQVEQKMLHRLSRLFRPRAKILPFPTHLGSVTELPLRLPIGDRYIALRFLSLYLTTLVGLWTLFIIFTVFELSSDILTNQIPARFVAEYLVALTPSVLSYLAPPSALMAALVSMSILSQSGELTALRAAGISIPRTAIPILVASALLAGAVAIWQEHVVPRANARQELLRFYIKKGRFPAAVELSPTMVNWMVVWPNRREAIAEPSSEASSFPPMTRAVSGSRAQMPRRILHFASLDRAARRLNTLLILDLSPDRFLVRRRLEAEFAKWDEARAAWHLSRVSVWDFEGAHLLSERHLDQLWLDDEGESELLTLPPRKPEAMTSRELRAQIRILTERGLDPTDLRIAVERRSANAAAVFIMALFGLPFGATFGRKGARHAIGLGIAIGLLYWLALGLFEQLGRYEYFSPRVAAWSPNGFLLALGLYLLFRVRT
ncbi:MAG: LptF/LptG family permease [Blastocatellia bacterium]|nr:LptF/LptG family permease [Blastocatellia bacterium]MCS7157128.1 LptF/LptG family permease [Blastocatellia bacterium]MCX7752409.1 LptF/LptG family permease [Blastocatellia bacterium]MDW8167292.1 LptF/LptG family permease [Acidobacteriota bacterium]